MVDLQVHLNRWWGSANYRRSFSKQRLLLVSQIPNFVGRQPTRDLIGRFAGSLEPLAGLSQLQELNLRGTKFTGQSVSEICLGYNQGAHPLADSRDTGSISNSRPIKDAQSLRHEV